MTENQMIAGSVSSHAGKYLSFYLAKELYGIKILNIREIIGLQSITRVPGTRDFIKGVINLRGMVIPIIDLRLRFGMEEVPYNNETCIVVVEVEDGVSGVIIDAVDEVIHFNTEDLEPAPGFQSKLEGDFILAMGKARGKILMLIDLESILNGQGGSGNMVTL
jgi:purine-binding chemotaxis protein CheW